MITRWAIRKSTTVLVSILLFVILGMSSYNSLPKEAAPDIKIPLIIVATPYFGVAPADIETLLTIPIEKKIKELTGIKSLKSTSAESSSMVTIEFNPDVDIDDAMQKVREKVDLAKPDLPPDAEDPQIVEINFSDFPIMYVNISGDATLEKLKEIGEDIQDEVETIQGVLDVDLVGGLEREIKIVVDPDRLNYYGLSFDTIINTIRAENTNIPGGSIEVGDMKYLVRVPGEFEKVSELRNIIVKNPKGEPIYLRDVASIKDDYKDVSTFARLNGQVSISLTVTKRTGENLIRIADEIKAIVDKKRDILPKTYQLTITADQSKQIRDMVKDLENNIITGMILVIAVVLFAMGFMNSTFVGMAIPLSMLISFIVIQAVGMTLNMIVLFSLILALGMLVDNAIVIVESIYRHMQEGKPAIEAAKVGTSEVAVPVFASTVTTLCAFLPLIFWPGIVGQFMGFLPKTLIITLSASLLIALAVNPVLCAKFMKVKKSEMFDVTETEDGDLEAATFKEGRFVMIYKRVLELALKHRFKTMGVTFTAFILTFMAYGQLGKGVIFFSETEPNRAIIDVKAPDGTKVAVTNEIVRRVEESVKKYSKDIKYVIANVGSGGQQDPSGGGGGSGDAYSHRGSVSIDFVDLADRSRPSTDMLEDIRQDLKGFTGATFEVKEEEKGPPAGKPISIEITGEDLPTLGRIARAVKKRVKDIEGIVDLQDDYNSGKPEITVKIDRDKAKLLKLNTRGIATTIRTAINGTKASVFREGDEEYDITVRLPEKERASFSDVVQLRIANKDDDQIPLSTIAKIETSGGLGSIKRKDSKRTVKVESNVQGRFSSAVLADVQKSLGEMNLPRGYNISFGGEEEDRKEASAFLSRAFMIVVFLIAIVLITQFNSIILPFIILTSVILSIAGVLIGLMSSSTPFSIILTGLGVISLAGVVVNNAIVLIDYIQQLRETRGLSIYDALIQAGMVRFRPVMLTAITTILGLLPMVTGISVDFTEFKLVIGGESSQMWFPMAISMVYGLAIATVLTLVVVPVLYSLLEGFREWTNKNFTSSKIKGLLRRSKQVAASTTTQIKS